MKRTLIDGNVLVGRLTSFQELFNTNSRELWGRLGMIIFQEIEPLDRTVCILYELTVRPCRHMCFPRWSLYLSCVIPPASACHLATSQRAERHRAATAGRAVGNKPRFSSMLDVFADRSRLASRSWMIQGLMVSPHVKMSTAASAKMPSSQ